MSSALYAALVIANDFDVHMNGGWWIAMMFGVLLFWALVILGIVWAVRSLGTAGRPSEADKTPIELLELRLAEGSISVEEYEERRSALLARERG